MWLVGTGTLVMHGLIRRSNMHRFTFLGFGNIKLNYRFLFYESDEGIIQNGGSLRPDPPSV